MALLHMAAAWVGSEIHAVTVNHGLRREAAEEAAFVQAVCADLGIAHNTLKWSDPQSSQAKARRARHALLSEHARDIGASVILTGHTADDDAETFLMRARRGSTWRGLAGMGRISRSPVWPEGRGVFIARPLLSHRREALRGFLNEMGQRWIDDPSNDNPVFERVRQRRILESNPSLASRVHGALGDLKRLRRLQDRRIGDWMAAHVTAHADGALSFPVAELKVADAPTAIRLLTQIASGGERPQDFTRLQTITTDILSGGPDAARTFGGAWIRRKAGELWLHRDPGLVSNEIRGGVWDGRFVKDNAAKPIGRTAHAAAKSLPPGEGWRALASMRRYDAIRALAAY